MPNLVPPFILINLFHLKIMRMQNFISNYYMASKSLLDVYNRRSKLIETMHPRLTATHNRQFTKVKRRKVVHMINCCP